MNISLTLKHSPCKDLLVSYFRARITASAMRISNADTTNMNAVPHNTAGLIVNVVPTSVSYRIHGAGSGLMHNNTSASVLEPFAEPNRYSAIRE